MPRSSSSAITRYDESPPKNKKGASAASSSSFYRSNEFGSLVDVNAHRAAALHRTGSGSSAATQIKGHYADHSDQETAINGDDYEGYAQGESPRRLAYASSAHSSSSTLNLDAQKEPFMQTSPSKHISHVEAQLTQGSAAGNWTPPGHQHTLYASSGSKRFVPPLMLLGPVLAVLFLTAGLATGMGLWVWTHKLPLTSDGVIYVREGSEEVDTDYTDSTLGNNNTLSFNTQINHATTLSISSVISTLVGNSVYPLMSLVAYSLAADWLVLQGRVAESASASVAEQLPTPLQYSLLVQLCGANSFEAVKMALQHTLRNKGSRASVPTILRKALNWLIVLLLFTNAIGWTDFWLHETTKTVQVIDVDPVAVSKNFSMSINGTTCDRMDDLDGLPCEITLNSTTGGLSFATANEYDLSYVGQEAWSVANNASKSHSVLTMFGKTGTTMDLSYLTASGARDQEVFRASTTGVLTTCRMVTAECKATMQSFNCSGIGHPELASNTTVLSDNLNSRLDLKNLAAVAGANASLGAQTNPLALIALLTYSLAGNADINETGFQNYDLGQAIWTYGMAVCNMTFYDLDVSFFNGSYSIDNQKVSNPKVAHALSGPLVAGLVTDPAVSLVASSAGRDNASDFAARFAHALSYYTLALSSGLFQSDPVSVNEWHPILASQYSRAPLYTYFGLLYAYAICAVVLFFWAWGTSSDCVTYDHPATGARVEVPAAVLAQRTLMDAGHLVATHLGNGPNHAHSTTGAAMSAMLCHATGGTAASTQVINRQSAIRTTSTDLLGLFDEPAHQERVVVGLESSGRGFGVWPMSQALGAVGRNGGKRDSMLRARTFWSYCDTDFLHNHHDVA